MAKSPQDSPSLDSADFFSKNSYLHHVAMTHARLAMGSTQDFLKLVAGAEMIYKFLDGKE